MSTGKSKPSSDTSAAPVRSVEYATPSTPSPADAHLHSVFSEPAITGLYGVPPARVGEEGVGNEVVFSGRALPPEPEASVWHEPALAVGAARPDELPYARFLREGSSHTSLLKSWMIVAALSLAAGPWAVFGAFWNASATYSQILATTLFGPTCEEVMKIAALTLALERRPYLFRSTSQIRLTGLAGGVCFAFIENLLYLYVYFPNASASLWVWRWSACVLLHTTCSMIAAQGLAGEWKAAMDSRSPLSLSASTPRWLLAAILLHVAYNTTMIVLEKTHLLEF